MNNLVLERRWRWLVLVCSLVGGVVLILGRLRVAFGSRHVMTILLFPFVSSRLLIRGFLTGLQSFSSIYLYAGLYYY